MGIYNGEPKAPVNAHTDLPLIFYRTCEMK